MRRFEDSTFVFISTNSHHTPGCVEERWLPVIAALEERGARIRMLALTHSRLAQWATGNGLHVDPYLLDRWNVVRARSRLRKYLMRYDPVVAHSTGVEADLLLRWATRVLPDTRIAHTLTEEPQDTRRRIPVNALMRRFDEIGMRKHADAVFVPDEAMAAQLHHAGVHDAAVIIDPPDEGSLERHLSVYRRFMAEGGS